MPYKLYGTVVVFVVLYLACRTHDAGPPSCVDIVIPVRHALSELKVTLKSLNESDIPFPRYHIVGDRIGYNMLNWLYRYDVENSDTVNLHYLDKPNVGYTYAVNKGISEGQCPYVLTANTDIIVPKNWFISMLRCIKRVPKSGMVGPLSNAASYQSVPAMTEYNNVSNLHEWSKNKLPSNWTPLGVSRAVNHLSDRVYPTVPLLNGFFILFKRKVFEDVGLFDTEFFQFGYGEENDFMLRAKKAGYLAVVDDSTYIYHHKTRSFSEQERKNLSSLGRQNLISKHSQLVVHAAEREMKQTMVASTKTLRDRLVMASPFSELFNSPSMKILFLLYSNRPGAGGCASVVREGQEMKRLGATVKIALLNSSADAFLSTYPEDPEIFVCPEDVTAYGILFDIVVATVWDSVYDVIKMYKIAPTFVPAYYVQDYEADFYAFGSENRRGALVTYNMIHNAGGFLFAKSMWLSNKVYNAHGIRPYVVPAAIEDLACQQYHAHNKSVTTIVAMLRPMTPRRNSLYTFEVLKLIKSALGPNINIVTFGCAEKDLPSADFEFTHTGILNRNEIGTLYADTDIFLDLSLWQAYGRSAAEAMTCGNTAIVTRDGGAKEFIEHDYNGFIVNIYNKKYILSIISNLVKSRDTLSMMQHRARDIRKQLLLRPAAEKRLHLFSKNLERKQRETNKHAVNKFYIICITLLLFILFQRLRIIKPRQLTRANNVSFFS